MPNGASLGRPLDRGVNKVKVSCFSKNEGGGKKKKKGRSPSSARLSLGVKNAPCQRQSGKRRTGG